MSFRDEAATLTCRINIEIRSHGASGANPNACWLRSCQAEIDERGFVLTGRPADNHFGKMRAWHLRN